MREDCLNLGLIPLLKLYDRPSCECRKHGDCQLTERIFGVFTIPSSEGCFVEGAPSLSQ